MERALKTRLIITLLFIVSLGGHVYSQDKEIKFDLLSMTDGLSQNTITYLYQDSKGFLWVGTPSGLNRYDGKHFKVYKNEPLDNSTLSNNYINCIAEDKDGNLWIATEYGLNKFDRFQGKFINYYHEEENDNSISENKILSIYIDMNNVVWIKTLRYLDRLDQKNGEIRHFEHYFDLFNPIAEQCTFPILESSEGELFVGSNDGLNVFNRKYEQFVRYETQQLDKLSISNNEIRCLFEDSDGLIWIGTTNGLNRYNRRLKSFEKYYYHNNNTSNNNIINSIEEDANGNLWLATIGNGLFKFNKQTKEFSQYKFDEQSPNGLISNDIYTLYKDYSDILWVGTRSGLNKLDIKNKKFITYKSGKTTDYKFSSNNITALYYVNESNILIGTKAGGLNLLNRKTDEVSIFSEQNKKLFNNHIYEISSIDNNIVIGTGDGLYLFDIATSSVKYFSSVYPCINQQLLYGKKISDVYQTTNGIIWIGTNMGLYRYNKEDKVIVAYTHKFSDNSTISSNDITTLFEDGNGNLWIGTNEGLNRFEASADMFERIVYEKNSNQGLSHNTVYAINEDAYGNLWIGTGAGLDMYDVKRGIFTYFTEKDGLPNNQIYSITKYNTDFWIGTNKGIVKLDTENNVVRNYDIIDGLQGYEFNVDANFVSPHGEIFIGGVSGFNTFYPDSILDNSIVPKVEITSFYVFGKDVRSNFSIEGKKEIKLPYENHSFKIEFAALEFTQPSQNNYEYMMEGLSDEWVECGNTNYANFSNLPSGEYVFKVRGSNNDKVWNKHPTVLAIIIETPLWKRPVAYILYILFVALIIYIFIEYRTRKLRKANKILIEKQQAALEITKQKEELSIKNKNITDSITYAKRIQWAIMPSRTKFSRLLPESFILYMPKDIVSGDFYWITEIEDKIFIASVDCTGHGVPGAFMSIIGFDLLRNITKEKQIHKPSEVLDELHTRLIELLTKNVIEGEVKDGMDLALCVFHKDKGILEYAGALNPLYIIRNNKIMTIRGDRFCVGLGNEHFDEDFKNHVIKLQKGDRIYIFSDGYADQFGGPNGKKMKYRRFRHLLLSIHNLAFDQQCEYLEQHINNWKGQLEQVDDILVMGMSFDNYL